MNLQVNSVIPGARTASLSRPCWRLDTFIGVMHRLSQGSIALRQRLAPDLIKGLRPIIQDVLTSNQLLSETSINNARHFLLLAPARTAPETLAAARDCLESLRGEVETIWQNLESQLAGIETKIQDANIELAGVSGGADEITTEILENTTVSRAAQNPMQAALSPEDPVFNLITRRGERKIPSLEVVLAPGAKSQIRVPNLPRLFSPTVSAQLGRPAVEAPEVPFLLTRRKIEEPAEPVIPLTRIKKNLWPRTSFCIRNLLTGFNLFIRSIVADLFGRFRPAAVIPVVHLSNNVFETVETTAPDVEPAAASQVLAAGNVYDGRYRLVSQIGKGGFAAVWLAEDTQTANSQVALKIDTLNNPNMDHLAIERKSLSHFSGTAGVVKLVDQGVRRVGCNYVVLEYIEGKPLNHFLRDERPDISDHLAFTDYSIAALRIISDVLAGLEQAHQHVVHSDISLNNILLRTTAQGREAILIDFGTARPITNQPKADKIIGKYQFMPPEQIMLQTLGAHSDLFALGVVGYSLFTGRRAFVNEQGLSNQEFDRQIIANRLVHGRSFDWDQRQIGEYLLPALGATASAGLAEVISRMSAVEIPGRFSTALEARLAVQTVLREVEARRAELV